MSRQRHFEPKEWSFQDFLARLDNDPSRAASKYELLRRRLILFFERSTTFVESEELADKTIDRVAKIIGDPNRNIPNLEAFAIGVAKNVRQEAYVKMRRETRIDSFEDVPEVSWSIHDTLEIEYRMNLLDRALDALPEADRKLILAYYSENASQNPVARRRLAEELEVSL